MVYSDGESYTGRFVDDKVDTNKTIRFTYKDGAKFVGTYNPDGSLKKGKLTSPLSFLIIKQTLWSF